MMFHFQTLRVFFFASDKCHLWATNLSVCYPQLTLRQFG